MHCIHSIHCDSQYDGFAHQVIVESGSMHRCATELSRWNKGRSNLA